MFLTRTAVLERMCGPLCEAVLDQPGAAATLAELARSNLLLVPLDAHGEWYRYHQLFRDMLLAELRRREPELIRSCGAAPPGGAPRNDLPEEAVEYSIAVGDVDMVAAPGGQTRGAGLPAGPGRRRPAVARVAGGSGRDRGTPDGGRAGRDPVRSPQGGRMRRSGGPMWSITGSTRRYPGRTVLRPRRGPPCLRAVLCQHGVKQMRADADEAARRFAGESI